MSGFDRINGVPSDPDEYVGSGGAKGEISSVLHVNTTQAGTAADTNETDLWSYTMPAGTLNANGKGVRVTIFGTYGANANTKTVRGYFGGTLVADIGAAAFNNSGWKLVMDVIRTGASAQVGFGAGLAPATTVATRLATPAGDTTTALEIKTTGQNGTAAANDVVFRGAIVEALN